LYNKETEKFLHLGVGIDAGHYCYWTNEISDLLTLVLINIDFNCIKEKDADLGDIRRILAKDVIIPAFNFDTMIAVNIVPNSKMGHDPNHMNIISWTHLMELYDEYANGEI